MPKSIVFICSDNVDMHPLLSSYSYKYELKFFEPTKETCSIQILDELCNNYVDFRIMKDQQGVREDYESNDMLARRFRNDLKGRLFYLVSYDNIIFLKRVIEYLVERIDSNCWVDDDHGKVLESQDFLANKY